MKKYLHYIADDIEEIKGYPRWQWLFIPTGVMKLTAMLKAYAKETHETDD